MENNSSNNTKNAKEENKLIKQTKSISKPSNVKMKHLKNIVW